MVAYTEAIPNLGPLTSHAAYAAGRISSNLKGSTKQFGWLQASATKLSFLSTASTNPATIRIDNFYVANGKSKVSSFDFFARFGAQSAC